MLTQEMGNLNGQQGAAMNRHILQILVIVICSYKFLLAYNYSKFTVIHFLAQHQASASPPSSSFTPTGHGSTNGLTNGTEPKPGNTSLGSPSIVNKAFPQEPKLCSNPSSLSRPITTAPAYTQASNISPEHHISQSTVRVTSSKEREATPSSLLSYDASVNFGSPHPPVTRESDLTRVSLISAGGSTDVEDTDGIARELYKEPTPNTLREPVTDESELERSIPEPHHFDSRKYMLLAK